MATQVQKAKCVIWCIETHSATTVQRLYRSTYRKVPPTRKGIYAWRKQLEETGCLCKGESSGRPRAADDTVEAVRRSYMRSPSKSTNRVSRELDMPQPTVWKILCKRLRMRP
jgi:transposase